MPRGTLELPGTIREGRREITAVVKIGPEILTQWLLELCLLRCHLAPAITFTASGQRPLPMRIAVASERPQNRRVEWANQAANLFVAESELAYWVDFFLQYYRSGRPPTDHIDVVLPPNHTANPKGMTLVPQVVRASS